MKKLLISMFSVVAMLFCTIGLVGCGKTDNETSIVGAWQFYSLTQIDPSGELGGDDYLKVGDQFHGWEGNEVPIYTKDYITLTVYNDGSIVWAEKYPTHQQASVKNGTWKKDSSNFIITFSTGDDAETYTTSISGGQLVAKMSMTETIDDDSVISVTLIYQFNKAQ